MVSSIASAQDLGTCGEKQATLWGVGKAPLMSSIIANTTASDTLDWEDCSWTGHPTASMVPVALGMCEAYGKTGRDYLTAMIGGFEVYQRIAGFIQPPKGWDHIKKAGGLALGRSLPHPFLQERCLAATKTSLISSLETTDIAGPNPPASPSKMTRMF